MYICLKTKINFVRIETIVLIFAKLLIGFFLNYKIQRVSNNCLKYDEYGYEYKFLSTNTGMNMNFYLLQYNLFKMDNYSIRSESDPLPYLESMTIPFTSLRTCSVTLNLSCTEVD
jgi:hypothetical protein